jgi:hypothetical protein
MFCFFREVRYVSNGCVTTKLIAFGLPLLMATQVHNFLSPQQNQPFVVTATESYWIDS